MYYYLKGVITKQKDGFLVLENNGIGYIINMANPYLYKINDEVKLYIYTHTTENKTQLFGFSEEKARDLFIKLISVPGIGPRTGLILISKDLDKLNEAIFKKDNRYLESFPGIGPKTSRQIIFNLSGTIIENTKSDPKYEKVISALKSLGYSSQELLKVKSLILENLDKEIGEILKLSLQNI